MREYTKTKVAYAEDVNGQKKTYITSETAWNKIVKDATEAKEPIPELVAMQTFAYRAAESVEEAVELCGGREKEDVFLGVFNYAASLRQDNAANDVLTDTNFTAQEGAIDVSYAVAEKAERAKMTPEEKAAKALGISADQLRAALDLIRSNATAAGA